MNSQPWLAQKLFSDPVNDKFFVYRCNDPTAFVTTEPWFPIKNICPCNPELSYPTGRGFTPCTFGIQTDNKEIQQLSSITLPPQNNNQKQIGALYQNDQYIPPQLWPRQNTRIGQVWRNPF